VLIIPSSIALPDAKHLQFAEALSCRSSVESAFELTDKCGARRVEDDDALNNVAMGGDVIVFADILVVLIAIDSTKRGGVLMIHVVTDGEFKDVIWALVTVLQSTSLGLSRIGSKEEDDEVDREDTVVTDDS
jgi:hypothetical protein